MGKDDEAMALEQEAYKSLLAWLGPDHPHTKIAKAFLDKRFKALNYLILRNYRIKKIESQRDDLFIEKTGISNISSSVGAT